MRLKDLCKEFIVPQRDKPKEFGGSIPWCRIEDIDGKYLNGTKSNQFVSNETIRKMNLKVIPEGSVICSCSASLGVQAILTKPCITNQTFIGIVPQKELSSELLFYFLKSKTEYFKKIGSGTTIPYISRKKFEELSLPEQLLNCQNEIVSVLSKVENQIALRKAELALLDNLIKARFVEMFGDPIRNTQNRKTTEFVNVVKMQRGFDLPVQDRQQNGAIPVYGSNGALDHHNIAKVQGGGVITGRSGTIGKVFYTDGDYWPLNTSLFSVDTHGNNVVYLAYLLEMFDLTRFVEGTGVPTLNRNMFHNKPIIDVGLNEQIRFAEFVKQVDKSKFVRFVNNHHVFLFSISDVCIIIEWYELGFDDISMDYESSIEPNTDSN